jgi:hypothetical protein
LYRSASNPDAGPRAVWQKVPLPPATREPGVAANDLSTGRLFAGQQALYVITHDQATFAVRLDGGP